MKLILAKTSQAVDLPKLMKLAGFIYIIDRKFGKHSYSRPLGNYHYPRFHCYLDDSAEQVTVNLHLDQKQASYVGSKRHSGEHDGPAVAEELRRLQNIALAAGYMTASYRAKPIQSQEKLPARKVIMQAPTFGSGDYNVSADKYKPRKSWWSRVFN